jgi:RHS repeat-associated protein
MYDYGARNYDPAIGRWMNIDRRIQTMVSYNYRVGNPAMIY